MLINNLCIERMLSFNKNSTLNVNFNNKHGVAGEF